MTKKKTKIVVVGIILIAFVATIGISYALWQINLQQTTENVITTGCFKIEFQDKNPIKLESAYPISDEEGSKLVPYEFTIINTCNSYASFQINLEILNATTLENLGFLKVMLEDKMSLLTSNDEVPKTLENAKTSYKLQTGYLRENGRKTFSLKIWMDDNTPTSEEFMNKLFESKVTVVATYKENLDNNIEVNAVSQNESFSDQETFQIHAISENYDLVSMSDDLETWEELETKGKDITVEKIVKTNGSHTFYFQDEAENIKEVTIISSKIDDKKPIANMSVAKENDVIKIDARSSLDNETSIAKYYYSKDGNNYEESTENEFQFTTNEYQYGIATTVLTNFERNQIKKIYLKVEDEVGNISEVKEFSITDTDFAYDETVDNNLRYIGANPNNYVSFNNELWRIIGVMNNIDDGTGKKETRIKLIRKESIGNYSWDSSVVNINDGYGVNEWSTSASNVLLNDYYYNQKSTETCYISRKNVAEPCDFSNIGLKQFAKNLIEPAVWYTGSNGRQEHYKILTNKYYELERSNNTGKLCSSGVFCNDEIDRTVFWKGKIGLMSPSDYGYATSAKCSSVPLFEWENHAECYEKNWLYDAENYQWTITPNVFEDDYEWSCAVFNVSSQGNVDGQVAFYNYSMHPALYLKSNTKITSGIGTEQEPFSLSLE